MNRIMEVSGLSAGQGDYRSDAKEDLAIVWSRFTERAFWRYRENGLALRRKLWPGIVLPL
jgi:hypothetical protein